MTTMIRLHCHSLVLSIYLYVTDLFSKKILYLACNKIYNALRGIFYYENILIKIYRDIVISVINPAVCFQFHQLNNCLYVMLHLLLSKQQLSEHSKRPFSQVNSLR